MIRFNERGDWRPGFLGPGPPVFDMTAAKRDIRLNIIDTIWGGLFSRSIKIPLLIRDVLKGTA